MNPCFFFSTIHCSRKENYFIFLTVFRIIPRWFCITWQKKSFYFSKNKILFYNPLSVKIKEKQLTYRTALPENLNQQFQNFIPLLQHAFASLFFCNYPKNILTSHWLFMFYVGKGEWVYENERQALSLSCSDITRPIIFYFISLAQWNFPLMASTINIPCKSSSFYSKIIK